MTDAPPLFPAYHLYGDDQRDVELDSVHIEPIHFRSHRHDWKIPPHVHPDHVQLLWFIEGWAKIRIEDTVLEVNPPCLVVHPAGMVHELHYQPETQGFTATVAQSYITRITQDDPRLVQALLDPVAFRIAPASDQRDRVARAFEQMQDEFNDTSPSRRMAIQAHLVTVLVELVRLRAAERAPAPDRRDKDLELLSRYRKLIEVHFRAHKTLPFYAQEMGVTTQRLNAACRARAGRTASEVLHDHTVTEAKRGLIYTEMTVSELAHYLGFDDPAYFNRFFSKRVGSPPGAFRADMAATQRVTDL